MKEENRLQLVFVVIVTIFLSILTNAVMIMLANL